MRLTEVQRSKMCVMMGIICRPESQVIHGTGAVVARALTIADDLLTKLLQHDN